VKTTLVRLTSTSSFAGVSEVKSCTDEAEDAAAPARALKPTFTDDWTLT